MYTMQFSCLGDWVKVMEGGPWSFRGNPVLMAPYDGFSKPSSIDLHSFKIWVQIHDLPDGFEPLVKPLAGKVGEFYSMDNRGRDFSGNYYRVRVILDVTKKLKNHVSIVKEKKRQIFKIKYERLPDWCAFCGMIGHLHTEHGDGVHPESALIFKELRASWGGGAGNRGGSWGDGDRRTAMASETQDDFSAMEIEDKSKSSDASDVDTDSNRKRSGVDQPPGMVTPGKQLMLPTTGAAVPPSSLDKQDLKRPKTAQSGNASNNSSTSAGSFEERRRDK